MLAKNLKSHPSVSQNLLKIQQERTSVQALINKTLRDVKDFKFDSLVAMVEEEHAKRNTLQNTISRYTPRFHLLRESEASTLLKDLQKQLTNEKKLLEDETNERNQVIQQLKDTIQEINSLLHRNKNT